MAKADLKLVTERKNKKPKLRGKRTRKEKPTPTKKITDVYEPRTKSEEEDTRIRESVGKPSSKYISIVVNNKKALESQVIRRERRREREREKVEGKN